MPKKIKGIKTKKTGVELPEGMKTLLKTTVAQRETLMKTAAKEAFEIWLLPEFGKFRSEAEKRDYSVQRAAAAAFMDYRAKCAAVPLQPGSTIASDGPTAIESPNLGEISGERKEWVLKLLRILQSGNEEVIQQTIHIIELGAERINVGSDISNAQSTRDHIDAPVKDTGTHRKKSRRTSGK